MMNNLKLAAHSEARSRKISRVLSVGQCGFDHRTITQFLKYSLDAETVAADTLEETIFAVRTGEIALVLVNRILDFDGTSGLDVIRALKRHENPRVASVPVMLVTNYADARRESEALGALPGFGKADLIVPPAKLITRLKHVLG